MKIEARARLLAVDAESVVRDTFNHLVKVNGADLPDKETFVDQVVGTLEAEHGKLFNSRGIAESMVEALIRDNPSLKFGG